MGKKQLRVFLLVRPDGRTPPASLSALIAALPEAPLHWNLPSCALSGSDGPAWRAFLEELEQRRPLDRLVALGYAGAPHPALQLEELRREVDWGLHPPGDQGRSFRPLPGVFAPAAADLLRPEALWLYATKGLRRMVVPAAGGWSLGAQMLVEGVPLQVLYSHGVRAAAAEPVGRLLARTGGLLCVRADARDQAALRSLLARLASRTRLSFAPLDEPLELPPGEAPAASGWSSDPGFRDRASSVSSIRTRRQASDETSSVLRVLAGLSSVAGPPRSVDVFPAARRKNTAEMMGAISLSDGALSAHFDSGRLGGFSWNGRQVTPAAAARSYAGASTRPRPFEVVAAYALEAERLRGLRTLCRLAGDPASLTLEYFFVEDCPLLLVSGRVRYPARRGLEQVTPLELAAARVPPGGLAVHVFSRGEAPYRVRVTEDAPPVCLAGSLFWFEDEEGGLAAGFPPLKEPPRESMRLRVLRVGGEPLVLASFFANADASQSFAGRDELFSLYFGVAFEPPRVLPGFARAVLEELPHHALGR